MSLGTHRLTLQLFVIIKSFRILRFPEVILYSTSAPALVKTGSQYVHDRKHDQKINFVILFVHDYIAYYQFCSNSIFWLR